VVLTAGRSDGRRSGADERHALAAFLCYTSLSLTLLGYKL